MFIIYALTIPKFGDSVMFYVFEKNTLLLTKAKKVVLWNIITI